VCEYESAGEVLILLSSIFYNELHRDFIQLRLLHRNLPYLYVQCVRCILVHGNKNFEDDVRTNRQDQI
jgi:hypothetical protein